MSPEQLAKSGTEAAHQIAVMAWCKMVEYRGFAAANDPLSYTEKGRADSYPLEIVPAIRWLHASANGGARGNDKESAMIRGAQLKAQGVKPGVYDLFWPLRRTGWAGLYIEMKKPGKLNATSEEQRIFGTFVGSQGFANTVCDNWQNAVKTIQCYWEVGE